MYNVRSPHASEFIDHEEILASLEAAKECSKSEVEAILKKAKEQKGLTHREALILLEQEDQKLWQEIFDLARSIKESYYGKRIVLFAPLYLSNYCVNGCTYCPYHIQNKTIARKKLSLEEVRQEAIALMDMGHKRLAIEVGEHPVHNPILYVIDCIREIYSIEHDNGKIRRMNVNIAATTQENYAALKEAQIGTYILFQETYYRKDYQALHPYGPKSDYDWHTEAMDRAMRAGIDDVGCGVLFGLQSYAYELCGLLMHAQHLEAVFGVGPHTISVPRICPADDVQQADFDHALSNELFFKIIAILRISVPYTGIIVSTRESQQTREKALELGVSQLSAASKTSVGGYASSSQQKQMTEQFDLSDHRSLDEVVDWLIEKQYIPSFCTACYREGRTGDRFMGLVKNGQIANICQPNALMTLREYLDDYASDATKKKGYELIARQVENIPSERVRQKTKENLASMDLGRRDMRF